MKKTLRVDYSGGINVITDKTVIPDKFATALDNVDLRSGFPRAFKEPIYMDSTYTGTTQVIDGVTVPVVRNPEITNNTKRYLTLEEDGSIQTTGEITLLNTLTE